MKTRAELIGLANATDFRPEALEKVYRLLAILRRLSDNELSRGQWVLKGGSAINLFHLNAPRLSIDIDINFTGVKDVSQLGSARDVFERVLVASCAREDCSVKRAPAEHAGGKFRLRFPSLHGGQQNLEVDVSYVARIPLFGVEGRLCSLSGLVGNHPVPLLTLTELAAGKFTALSTRSAARDYYDALSLTEYEPAVLETPQFRVAFLCQVASSRSDLRRTEAPQTLGRREVEQKLIPLLRIKSSTAQLGASALLEKLNEVVTPVFQKLVQWSEEEKRFLDAFLDSGEIAPHHLTDDKDLQARISEQSMLLWKQMHVRKHLGLDSE